MTSTVGKIGDGSERTRTRRGFLRVMSWSFVAEAGGQLTTLMVGLLLAVLVGPEAYGVVAMAMAYVLLVDLVQRQGVVSALIQRRSLEDAHLSSAFWLVMGTSGLLTIASVALAGWWSAVNGVPLLAPVICALSALLPLKALVIVQEALLRRELALRVVALRTSVSVMIGGVAGVVHAVFTPSVWTFVVQQIVAAAAAVVLLWSVKRWTPRPQFSRRAVRDLLGFSTGSFVSSLGTFVTNRADVVVIGVLLGPVAVGLYSIGMRLTDAVIGLALRPVQAMALPELSPYQGQLDQFRIRLNRLERFAALLGLPLLGVLAASANAVVVLLGPAWAGAELTWRLLVVVAAVRVVTGLNGAFLQALGRPHLNAVLTWVFGIVGVVAVVVSSTLTNGMSAVDQAAGVAFSRVISSVLVGVIVHVALLKVLLRVSIVSALGRFLPASVAALAAFSAGTWVSGEVLVAQPWTRVVVVLATSTCAAVVALLALEPNARRLIYRLIAVRRTGLASAASASGSRRRYSGRHRAPTRRPGRLTLAKR